MDIDTTTYKDNGYISVFYEGDDLIFDTVAAAQAFIAGVN